MGKTKTTITIHGKTYTIVSEESGEYVTQVGYYVDEKMRQLNADYIGLSTNMLQMLTAINLADELLKSRASLEAARAEVKRLKEMLRDLKIKNQVYSSDTGSLQGRLSSAEAENGKLKELIQQMEREMELLKASLGEGENNVTNLKRSYK